VTGPERPGPGPGGGVPAGDLLPHRPPLLLIGALTRLDADGCTTETRVDGGAWYAIPDADPDAGGAMPAWFGLELMAQSIAAYSGSRHQQHGRAPRPGYLLGTRKYACTVAAFPAGALLEVEVRLQFADPGGLSAFACVLRCDGAELAHAILKVFEPR